jgi:haloacetate dehalogenase
VGPAGSQGSGHDVLAVWREHAETVSGHGIDSGHFLPKEAREETYRALRSLFSGGKG